MRRSQVRFLSPAPYKIRLAAMQAFFIFGRASMGLALALFCIASAPTALQLSPSGSGIALQRILWLGDGPLGGEIPVKGYALSLPHTIFAQKNSASLQPYVLKNLLCTQSALHCDAGLTGVV